jgi:hypothetical protein
VSTAALTLIMMTGGAEELTSDMDDDEGGLWAHGHEWAEACSICFANRYACTLCVKFMIGSRTRRLYIVTLPRRCDFSLPGCMDQFCRPCIRRCVATQAAGCVMHTATQFVDEDCVFTLAFIRSADTSPRRSGRRGACLCCACSAPCVTTLSLSRSSPGYALAPWP